MKIVSNQLIKQLVEDELIPFSECSADELVELNDLYNQNLPLPEGVFRIYTGSFVRVVITDEQITQYLLLSQTKRLNTIKNCCVYFVVISVLTILFSLFALIR